MTKLEQLIKELCPNGVKYVAIKDYFTRLKGTPITAGKMKEIESPDGEIRIFAGGKTVINAHEKDIPNANITRVPAVLVQSRGVIDFIYYEKPFTFKNEMWAYTAENKITVKYLYYFLQNNTQHFRDSASGMGSLPQISLHVTEDFKIPVPPLEVQAEIVKILDEYTESVTALQQELTAELTARKKQYEYYRDRLLDFGVHGGGTSECEWRTFGTVIISLKTGLNPRQNFSLNENGSNLPYITGKDIYDNAINVTERTDRITTDALTLINKRANLESGLLLFASTGTGTVGRMAIIQEYNNDWGISETLYAIKVNENIILTSFLLHYLYSASAKSQFEPKISKGSVPHLKVKDLENVKVPIISIEEQTRIVNILDRFDKLCNDISEGLPAEIEARRKQYEYYRDKLLSFKERKNA